MSDSPQAREMIEPPQDAVALAASPPLSIAHFLLWMAGTAVYLTLTQIAKGLLRQNDVSIPALSNIIFAAVFAVAVGPGVASWAIFAWRRFHGIRFPTQPGEWLLLITGASYLVDFLTLLLLALSWPPPTIQYSEMPRGLIVKHLLWQSGTPLFSCLCFALAAFWVRRPRSWMVFYLLLIVQNLAFALALATYSIVLLTQANWIQEVGQFLGATSPRVVLGVLPIVALSLAIAMDLKRGRRRDWLHWTGIAVYVSISLLHAIWFFWARVV